jgi:hypothetical protein
MAPNDDGHRHHVAWVDYSLCRQVITWLWLNRNMPMVRTRTQLRAELRYYVACAKRAKQVMRSTAPC